MKSALKLESRKSIELLTPVITNPKQKKNQPSIVKFLDPPTPAKNLPLYSVNDIACSDHQTNSSLSSVSEMNFSHMDIPNAKLSKKKLPTLFDMAKVERDLTCLTQQNLSIMPSMKNTEKGEFENNGVYGFQYRESGTSEYKFFAGEPVQEMLDPGRTKGCYFTVDKDYYKSSEDMVRGFSALNQIGLIPHKHSNPEIYIITDNTTFCGVNKKGNYSTINLKRGVLVLINGNAYHGIHKQGVYKIKKFSSQFYFVFPKQKDKIVYEKCEKDMSLPEMCGPFDFDGVRFYD